MVSIGYNHGFNGYLTPYLAFCPFPLLPDFYEVMLPGVGVLNPSAYPCSPGGLPAIRGMDYSDNQQIYVTDTSGPTVPGIYTSFVEPVLGSLHDAFQLFGLASAVGNSTAITSGNCDRGVFVCMSGAGGQGNEQGYGLLLSHGGIAQLVQFTQGLTQFEVLAFRTNVWTIDAYTNIRLQAFPDPYRLKGVYLRAIINSIVMTEFVYAGSFGSLVPYIPTGPSFCGWGIIAYNTTVVFTGNLPEN